jgi:hypothetical protein
MMGTKGPINGCRANPSDLSRPTLHEPVVTDGAPISLSNTVQRPDAVMTLRIIDELLAVGHVEVARVAVRRALRAITIGKGTQPCLPEAIFGRLSPVALPGVKQPATL